MAWGFGLACQIWGIKAGLSLAEALTIFIICYVQFFIMAFTVLEDVKLFIKTSQIKTENEKANNL